MRCYKDSTAAEKSYMKYWDIVGRALRVTFTDA